jgi:hypothetical protein
VIARWVAFWDRREAPHSLALARLLLGSVILADFAGIWRHGLVPDSWLLPPGGLGWGAARPDASSLIGWLASSPTALTVLAALGVLAAAAVTLGLGLRPAALVLVAVSALFGHLAPSGERAIDMLARIVLIVLALSRADACWSLSAVLARRRGAPTDASIAAWPRQLLFAQLVWVYFSAAQNRGGPAWWPSGHFAALATVLSDPHFAAFHPGWTRSVYPLTQLGTALTMVFELGSPLLLLLTFLDRSPEGGMAGRLVRRLRLRFLWLALGVSLHLGIAATMRLGIFPYGMLALYPLFFDPGEVQGAVQLLARVARPGRVE